jgi:hypothetical protein
MTSTTATPSPATANEARACDRRLALDLISPCAAGRTGPFAMAGPAGRHVLRRFGSQMIFVSRRVIPGKVSR